MIFLTKRKLDWVGDSWFIFITVHRRENLGEPMHNMFWAIRRVLEGKEYGEWEGKVMVWYGRR